MPVLYPRHKRNSKSQVLYKGDNAPKVDYLILSVILVSLKTDIAGLEEDLKNGKEMTYN